MRQRKSVLGFTFALACALAACGGKTDDSDDVDDASQPRSPSQSEPPSGAPAGDTALGPCMPGFNPADEPTNACDWLADGLCYDSKIAACSCVCPRNKKNSTCVSGFFQENGRTEVSCF